MEQYNHLDEVIEPMRISVIERPSTPRTHSLLTLT